MERVGGGNWSRATAWGARGELILLGKVNRVKRAKCSQLENICCTAACISCGEPGIVCVCVCEPYIGKPIGTRAVPQFTIG